VTTTSTAVSEDVLEALGVLADPQRRQILLRLGGGAVCTCTDLVAETGVGQPTVSHHLKVLREAGLVVGERCGRFVNYTAVPERLRELGAAFEALAASAEAAQHC
jgi:ArsR family transcriptional regulator, arsenate/arsenite/antimonite-responsive transcriptional repressor